MLRTVWFLCLLLIAAGSQAAHTYEFGACEQQLLWRDGGVLTNQLEHLDAMQQAGADWIRLSLIYNNQPWNDSKLIAHIKRCNELGIKVLMVLESGQPGLYPPGTEKRPGSVPQGQPQWDSYRLSDLDLTLSETYIRKFFTALNASNALIHAVEMFNEINWNAFNGDLPLVTGGLRIDGNTAWDDPVFTPYRAGIAKVAQLTKTVSALNNEFFGGTVKIITAGQVGFHTMNSNWFSNVKGGMVSQELTLQLMHGSHPMQTSATNYLQYADGIGMHIYPSVIDFNLQTAVNEIAADLAPLLVIPGAGTTKPFWITECGYARSKFASNETNRFNQLAVFYDAFDLYDRPKSAVGAVFHFAFSADCNADHAVWDDGIFYKSADIFKTPGVENTVWTNRLFEAWQVEHFGDQAHLDSVASDTADFDGDGMRNLAEYVSGTDPGHADMNQPLIITGQQAVFNAQTNDPLTVFELQHSERLAPAPDWQAAACSGPSGTAEAGIYRFTCPLSGEAGFYRLRFSRTAP